MDLRIFPVVGEKCPSSLAGQRKKPPLRPARVRASIWSFAERRSSCHRPLPMPATRRLIFEVEEPPAAIPLQRHLPPSQWNLGIWVERADVRPSRWRILLWIGHRSVVWVRRIAWPSIVGQARLIVSGRRHARRARRRSVHRHRAAAVGRNRASGLLHHRHSRCATHWLRSGLGWLKLLRLFVGNPSDRRRAV